MKRTFCDLCDAPIGSLGPNVRHESERMADGVMIDVSINFTLRNHPTGYGGPPDLCGECIRKLVGEVFDDR